MIQHDPDPLRSTQRAYNCSENNAKGIVVGATAFHRAVQVLGPIRARYSQIKRRWMLDARPATVPEFIAAADAARERMAG